jgi:hypothetical protein
VEKKTVTPVEISRDVPLTLVEVEPARRNPPATVDSVVFLFPDEKPSAAAAPNDGARTAEKVQDWP